MVHEALWKASFVASSLLFHSFTSPESMENSLFSNEDSRFVFIKNFLKL